LIDDLISDNKTVGLKQSLKAVRKGEALKVYVAYDADKHVQDAILSCCEEHGVAVLYFDSCIELGKAAGITVGAAVVAILK